MEDSHTIENSQTREDKGKLIHSIYIFEVKENVSKLHFT